MRRRDIRDGARLVRGATREKKAHARELRAEQTAVERILWHELRARRLGVRFRRQHVIAGFIVDFYCAIARLAIEVDGGVHDEKRARDEARTRALNSVGITVIRFHNGDVLGHIDRVLATIRARVVAATASSTAPLLSPESREKGGAGGG